MATIRPNLTANIDTSSFERYLGRLEQEAFLLPDTVTSRAQVAAQIEMQRREQEAWWEPNLGTSAITGPNYTATQVGMQQDAFLLSMHQEANRLSTMRTYQPYTYTPPARNTRNELTNQYQILNDWPIRDELNRAWTTPVRELAGTSSPFRHDLVLYRRRDSATPNPRLQRKTITYRNLYFDNMLHKYKDLHIIFPRHSAPNNHHLNLNFRKESYGNQDLYINDYIALQFIAIIKQEIIGEVLEIHLCKIYPVGNDRNEKLKRLFLRHMGFNCIRYDNKLKILFRDGTSILLPKDKHYRFDNQSSSGYTNGNSKIGTLLIKANSGTKF